MIRIENIEVWGFEHAIRGMRNPLNSWNKSDSGVGCCKTNNYSDVQLCSSCDENNNNCNKQFIIGSNDLDLMRRLCKAGQPHRKYLRQIMISMDITAPLYWWKEFDTYKVGTTANSCSTMHKIHDKEFTLDDFSHEHLIGEEDDINEPIGTLAFIVDILNMWRSAYLQTKDKEDWWQMIQLLPSSYNQRRTLTMNYENAVNMIQYRMGHKLDEWVEFINVLGQLPYLNEIIEEV